MSLKAALLTTAIAATTVMGLSGCNWDSETGFVEVSRSINWNAADLLMLNSIELNSLAQKDHLILQERVGSASLLLKRGEVSQKLCDFEVKKNRVVSVTLTYVNSSIRCIVQR